MLITLCCTGGVEVMINIMAVEEKVKSLVIYNFPYCRCNLGLL